jgi:hypothetical protein
MIKTTILLQLQDNFLAIYVKIHKNIYKFPFFQQLIVYTHNIQYYKCTFVTGWILALSQPNATKCLID